MRLLLVCDFLFVDNSNKVFYHVITCDFWFQFNSSLGTANPPVSIENYLKKPELNSIETEFQL